MSEETQTYLGDGLYVSFDGYQFKLWASNGIRTTDEVYLDPGVLKAFLDFIESTKPAEAQP